MDYFLISCCLPALALFALMRPRWRKIGPSLLDSFVIGLSLFAVGSILVWLEGLAHSETVMRIGVSAALSGILGASLWGYLLAPRMVRLDFFADTGRLCADSNDHFVISTGLAVSTLASLTLLVVVASHPHIRSLLFDAVVHGSGTLNQARIIISSGSEGYFAPGYVKQFRDIIVPILCVAAILCDGTYRHRGLIYVALVVALATTFISGQRLVIIQYILCLGTSVLIDRLSRRPRLASLTVVIALLLLMAGTIGFMTKMLGRLDVELSPVVEQQKLQARENFVVAERERDEALRRAKVAADRINAAVSSGLQNEQSRTELEEASAEVAAAQEKVAELQKDEVPNGAGALLSSGIPVPILAAVAIAHRAVVAVPRENTISYPFWSRQVHAFGSGWLIDLAGILPGTQKQLSNELSAINSGTRNTMGNSPLGLATDIFYNWGWLGVMIVPPLYALGFLWLDIALTASRSALTSAAKIFMFFAIPLMYSPFMFVLYGGFVAVGVLCYAHLRRNGALSFLGIRPQTRQLSL